jgi:hypothetical protein
MVAFEGWNDAGDASSLALEYLAQAWDAERLATIDPPADPLVRGRWPAHRMA